MPLTVIELVLRLVIAAMEGQTPEQKRQMWDWYIKDVERWRKLLHLDAE